VGAPRPRPARCCVTDAPEAPKGGAWVSETRIHRGAITALSWDARGLWRQLRGYSADNGTDGVIARAKLHVAVERTIPVARAEKYLAELVAEGCAVIDGDNIVLDWSDQPSAEVWNDPVKRMVWARANQLKRNGELCKAVQRRDRNCCRYCGIRVDWNIKVLTKKVTHGGSYDHVDPDDPINSLENVVVACRLCNSRKGHRTPEQAGMTLYKPGTTARQVAEAQARAPTPAQPPVDLATSDPLRAHARPDTANPGPTPAQPTELRRTASLDRVSVPPPSDHDYPGSAA
jgi:5-methylcytosine-specific restriction endonuclease McrA